MRRRSSVVCEGLNRGLAGGAEWLWMRVEEKR